MPYAVKGNELVPVRDAPSEVFVEFERADEDQIVATMQGAALEEYVYSFDQGGTTVTGLSWVGTREAARHQGGIHISEPKITETDETFTVMVSAHDRIRDVVVWGGASQAKVITFRNGGSKADPFAFQKALSKAQRNAMMAVLPTTVIVKMLDAYRNRQQNVRRVAPPPKQTYQAPKPEPAPAVRVVDAEQSEDLKAMDRLFPATAKAAMDAAVAVIEAETVEGEVVEESESAIPAEIRAAGGEIVNAFSVVKKSLQGAQTLEALATEWAATKTYLKGVGAGPGVLDAAGYVKDQCKAKLTGQLSL